MTNFDPYADDAEPKAEQVARVFKIAVPGEHGRNHFALVKVDVTGYCELDSWAWGEFRNKSIFKFPEDRAAHEAWREVWSWLAEWEFVELRPIGPEDSEHFATEKLTGAI